MVGAIFEGTGGATPGAAYVFIRDAGGSWSEQAKLIASDGASWDYFGRSVSVDGDVAVVGAYRNSSGATQTGSAYVFKRTGGTWSEKTKLTASDGSASDWFGFSVSVFGDSAVVGSYGDDDAGDNSGSAYVFTGAPIPVQLQRFSVD